MKKTIPMVILALVMVGFTSCSVNFNKKNSSYARADITNKISGFHKLNIEAPCNVVYRQSDTLKVEIAGNTDNIKKIKSEVKDSTLILRRTEKQEILGISNLKGVKVYISSPDLTKIELSSAGAVNAKGKVDTDNMIVLLKGAGNITFEDLICDMFYSSIKGVGNIKVEHLTAPKSSIFLNGVGNTNINYDYGGDVSCKLRGVGNIKLSGNVKDIKQSINGTGHINTDNVNKK